LYSRAVDVGSQTTCQLTDLDPSQKYYFAIQAYDFKGNISGFSTEISLAPSRTTTASPVPDVPTLTNLSANLPSPQNVGASVTFTAAAAGGAKPYEYQWLVSDGTAWNVAENWSLNNNFMWTPDIANANYRVGVVVRSAGENDPTTRPTAGGSMPFVIAAPAGGVAVTSLTANSFSTSYGPVTVFTVKATGAAAFQYEWSVFDGTSWQVRVDWSRQFGFAWGGDQVNGAYQVKVRVRNASNWNEVASATMPFPAAASAAR
jgi:hypothetical protein